MADIFSKYSATPINTVKKIAEEENSKTVSNRFADRLEISEGLNKIRIGPKHPGEQHFMHMRACHWISIDGDNGPQRRTVSNARVMLGVEEDPIESYVQFCKEKLADGEEDHSEKLKNLTDWQKGLNLSMSWMSYAKLIKGEKRSGWQIWEYSQPVRDLLLSEMVIEDEDEALTVDPFTNPKTGRSVLLTYTAKTKKTKAKRTIKLAEKAAPLSADELVAYDKLTPINNLPEFNYSMKDYDLALEGLAYYDESEEINLIDDEEFVAILAKIKKDIKKKLAGGKAATDAEDVEENDELPFDEDEADEDEKPKKTGKGIKATKPADKKKPGKKVVEEDEDEPEEEEKPKGKRGPKKKVVVEEPEEDEVEEAIDEDETPEPDKFDGMERRDLIAYKAKKGYEEVKIYKSDEDDDIRTKLREHEASLDEVETDEPEEDEVEEAPKSKKKTDDKSAISLDSIKKQMAERSKKAAAKK